MANSTIPRKVEVEEVTIGEVLFHKEGGIVSLSSNRNVSMDAAVYNYLCDVPEAYRPRAIRYAQCLAGNAGNVVCNLRVQPSGRVDIYSPAVVSNQAIWLGASYII